MIRNNILREVVSQRIEELKPIKEELMKLKKDIAIEPTLIPVRGMMETRYVQN
jgi:hypothetical protein